jgi:hypothetical protein
MRLEQLRVWQRHKHLAVAVVDDEAGVLEVVKRLHGLGVSNDQLSLIALDVEKVHGLVETIGPQQGQLVHEGRAMDAVADETSPKGRNEVEGMAIGGGVGLVIGLCVFAIPGLGATLLAAGPVVMAINVLGHAAAGGIGMGMLLGAIFDERVTEAHRECYRERLQAGHWLLIVEGDEALVRRAGQTLSGDHVERVEVF